MSMPQGEPPKYDEANASYPSQPGYQEQQQPYPPQPQPGGGGVPPMAGYAPQPQPQGEYPAQPGVANPPNQQTTVLITQPGVAHGRSIRYTQSPALIRCQCCGSTVTTTMDYKSGVLTWAIGAGLCIFGCIFGCCLIPFCINGTKDIEHRCPNCNQIVGSFRHFR